MSSSLRIFSRMVGEYEASSEYNESIYSYILETITTVPNHVTKSLVVVSKINVMVGFYAVSYHLLNEDLFFSKVPLLNYQFEWTSPYPPQKRRK